VSVVDVDFVALQVPLHCCGNAYKDFEAMFVKCAERSGAVRMSFQGWVRLEYIVGRRHVRDGRNVTVPTGTDTRVRARFNLGITTPGVCFWIATVANKP
jgi:hypothetical protein